MNTTTTTGSITERAMLVTLSIKQWSARKHDKKISREVAESHGCGTADVGKYNKILVAGALDSIKKASNAARTEHYFRTLPWQDGGGRILSSAGYLTYQAAMKPLEDAFWAGFHAFSPQYSALVEADRDRLNGMFNPQDYPEPHKLSRHFEFSIEVLPLPTAADFRVDLGDAEVERVRQSIQERESAKLSAAQRDTWMRLRDVVQHASDRLKAYQVLPSGKAQHPFRDSLVTNIDELLDILPTLNLMRDQTLDTFAARIRSELTTFKPADLRDSEPLRKSVASEADSILANMAEFVA